MTNSTAPKFFDTHCHLHEAIFDDTREEIIARMRTLGVDKFLTVGTTVKDTERALRLRDKYPEMCLVSASIDPTMTQQYVDDLKAAEADFKQIRQIAEQEDISAIGETGLDKNWILNSEEKFTSKTLEIQHLLFELHIQLAKDTNLPLVIHQRGALSPILKTLKSMKFMSKDKKLGVFHCFTGDTKDMKRIVEAGFYVGIGGIVTFKNASKLQGAVKNTGAKDILFETDAPFLSPEPYRGMTNTPERIPLIAEYVEGLKGESLTDLVYQQSSKLFIQ